jgi:hypothetical protein
VRGAPVYKTDKLMTGKDGRLVIRMTDAGTLALSPGSTLMLRHYEFNAKKPETQVALYELIRGSARVLTGKISPERFGFQTSSLYIGVRGTLFDVITRSARTTVSVFEGSVGVRAREAAEQQAQAVIENQKTAIQGAMEARNSLFDQIINTREALLTEQGKVVKAVTPTEAKDVPSAQEMKQFQTEGTTASDLSLDEWGEDDLTEQATEDDKAHGVDQFDDLQDMSRDRGNTQHQQAF